MINGGVCVLDEGNRMNEKSWASLAPLLDHRRYVESVVAGIVIPAHPDFRACVTMNEDESTYEVPDYIMSRLQPTLALLFPNRDDEMAILKYHLPFAEDALLAHSWSGAPLEAEHGGPVRLVVPHLYFWKSAKWLQSIEFLEKDAPGYWEVRGYHNRGDPWAEQRYSGD